MYWRYSDNLICSSFSLFIGLHMSSFNLEFYIFFLKCCLIPATEVQGCAVASVHYVKLSFLYHNGTDERTAFVHGLPEINGCVKYEILSTQTETFQKLGSPLSR